MFISSLKTLLVVATLAAQSARAFPAPSLDASLLPPSARSLQPRQESNSTASTHEHEHGHGHQHDADHAHAAVTDFPIHSSCNASQAMQIRTGLNDMNKLLQSATQHLLLHGNNSELFQTYFGGEADPAVPLGYYSRILSGDKSETLFRCDDIDGNCQLPEWNGHWRGNNATGETVICELSYWTRLPLEKACSFGWTLATGGISAYWGTDLMHRAMHLPQITNEKVGHTADSYTDLVALAKKDTVESVRNQHTLQTFAFEVWSRENVAPEGCVGAAEAHEEDHDHAAETSSAPAAAAPTATASSAGSGSDCHTHADGSVHCGSH